MGGGVSRMSCFQIGGALDSKCPIYRSKLNAAPNGRRALGVVQKFAVVLEVPPEFRLPKHQGCSRDQVAFSKHIQETGQLISAVCSNWLRLGLESRRRSAVSFPTQEKLLRHP